MDWIDLGDPRPRDCTHRYTPIAWPDGDRTRLPKCPKFVADFRSVALGRRTRRAFGPITSDALGALLHLTSKVQQQGETGLGFAIQKRPTPSAGAIHPIHLVFADQSSEQWRRYDASSHELRAIVGAPHPRGSFDAMQRVMPAPGATLMLLAAEPGKTAAKYLAVQSLVIRDAGVLLGTMALSAEALDLTFCPLGETGDVWVRQLVEQRGLVGVGAAFLGSTP